MGLFKRRHTAPAAVASDALDVPEREEQPPWIGTSLKAALMVGGESLEVVGESRRQDNLRSLVGDPPPEQHVREHIQAILYPESRNPADPNAISVWIGQLQVGYLSRENAERYRAGLLELQLRTGMPIALPGVITGGGLRPDGPGRLGVFLDHNPEDFGLRGRPFPREGMRTGLSDAIATDDEDDGYNLDWVLGIPSDPAKAITYLRDHLAGETDIISRHYIYDHLESVLYKRRDTDPVALPDYDRTCRDHDGEMDSIRQALIAKWGRVPVLPTYRQMAIRQQKAHDYQQALWWAERGIALYATDIAKPEALQDLQQRAATYRAKIN